MDKTEKKITVCRSCGGKTVVGELKPGKKGDTFEHIVFKCRNCGAWCGGHTIPKKKEQ